MSLFLHPQQHQIGAVILNAGTVPHWLFGRNRFSNDRAL